MSGYVRMNKGLRDNIKVRRLRALTKLSLRDLAGALYLLWAVADEHADILWTEGFGPESKIGDGPGEIPKGYYFDALLQGWTDEALDEECGTPGFTAALADSKVEWIKRRKTGLVLPAFTKFNNSVKRRALAAVRQKDYRSNVTRNAGVTGDPKMLRVTLPKVARHVSPQHSSSTAQQQHSTAQTSSSTAQPPPPSPAADAADAAPEISATDFAAAPACLPERPRIVSARSAVPSPQRGQQNGKALPTAASNDQPTRKSAYGAGDPVRRALIAAGFREPSVTRLATASAKGMTPTWINAKAEQAKAKGKGTGWIIAAIESEFRIDAHPEPAG